MSGDLSLFADIAELRRRVVTATNFAEFWDYYFTSFLEREAFLRLGQPVHMERAVDVLESSAGMMMGREGPVVGRNLVLVEVPAAGIVHGSGVFDGRLGAVLYVAEFDVGMFAIWVPGGGMRFARFWLKEEKAMQASA